MCVVFVSVSFVLLGVWCVLFVCFVLFDVFGLCWCVLVCGACGCCVVLFRVVSPVVCCFVLFVLPCLCVL